MKKIFYSSLAAVALLLTSTTPKAHAENSPAQKVAGTWTFFVTIPGGPPCQCIQIARLHPDGSFDGPANDRLSGEALGIWKQTGAQEITFALVQNNINPDGSAAGEYSIHAKLTLNAASDHGTGSGTLQLLDKGGKVTSTNNFTLTAEKLKLE
jgi:hypothetical protein